MQGNMSNESTFERSSRVRIKKNRHILSKVFERHGHAVFVSRTLCTEVSYRVYKRLVQSVRKAPYTLFEIFVSYSDTLCVKTSL